MCISRPHHDDPSSLSRAARPLHRPCHTNHGIPLCLTPDQLWLPHEPTQAPRTPCFPATIEVLLPHIVVTKSPLPSNPSSTLLPLYSFKQVPALYTALTRAVPPDIEPPLEDTRYLAHAVTLLLLLAVDTGGRCGCADEEGEEDICSPGRSLVSRLAKRVGREKIG